MSITTRSLKLLLLIIFASLFNLKAELFINEIMPVPIDGEPEWIELYYSGTIQREYVSLTISDAATTKKIPSFTAMPDSYIILVKDSTSLKSIRDVPHDAIFVIVTPPTMNNTSDILMLKDSLGNVTDSVYYDMKWGEQGLSLERITIHLPAVDYNNWSKSADKSGATPGAINSNVNVDYDIACETIKLNESYSKVMVYVKDYGILPTDKFAVNIYCDVDNNDSFDDDLLFTSLNDIMIEDKEATIEFPLSIFSEKVPKNGVYELTAITSSVNDRKPVNDTCRGEFYFRVETPIIKINEIMYDVNSERSEFIELWNGGNDTLLLDNFYIWDAAGNISKGNIQVKSSNFKIPPHGYGIVCWDSLYFENYPEHKNNPAVYYYKSSFNLNQTGDLIVVADFNGKIYDSLTYSNKWHNQALVVTKNRSLEKVNEELESSEQSYWTSSRDISGATPLAANSTSREIIKNTALSINPNPFAPNSMGNDANALIYFELPYETAFVNAYIYDISGFEVTRLANNKFTTAKSSLIWDGKNKDSNTVQVGQYVFLLEATDTQSGSVFTSKSIIVVGN